MTWPRPHNKKGIHWGDIATKYIDQFLPLMKELDMGWTVLFDGDPVRLKRAAERFLKEGIMPILRLDAKINGNADFSKAAKDSPTPWWVIYNEFGDEREWRGNKRPNDWWPIARDKWIKQAHRVRSVGCKPGLQVMSPDELWDMLEWMKLGGDDILWPDMWIALHQYPAFGCPPDCREHKEYDILGLDGYIKICEHWMGYVPPIIVTEGGYTDGQGTPEDRARWMPQVYDSLPDYVLAFCPWILFGTIWYGFSWADNTAHHPMLEAIKMMGKEPPEEPQNWRVVSDWFLAKRSEVQKVIDALDKEFPTCGWDLEERKV